MRILYHLYMALLGAAWIGLIWFMLKCMGIH